MTHRPEGIPHPTWATNFRYLGGVAEEVREDCPSIPIEGPPRQGELSIHLTDFPFALLRVGQVMAKGAKKYGDGKTSRPNWEKIEVVDHIGHAISHLIEWLTEVRQPSGGHEDHLAHAACRVMMAIELIGLPPQYIFDSSRLDPEELAGMVAELGQPRPIHFKPGTPEQTVADSLSFRPTEGEDLK